jgi:hypothetical protein
VFLVETGESPSIPQTCFVVVGQIEITEYKETVTGLFESIGKLTKYHDGHLRILALNKFDAPKAGHFDTGHARITVLSVYFSENPPYNFRDCCFDGFGHFTCYMLDVLDLDGVNDDLSRHFSGKQAVAKLYRRS